MALASAPLVAKAGAMGMPAKYASEKATPLTVQVKAGTNTFDFVLTQTGE